jgi:hypothetical protein
MAKILTDAELLHIVTTCIVGGEIDDRDQYMRFLEDLADAVTMHFGGERGRVTPADSELPYTVTIHWNDSVPDGGGIYQGYDTDEDWSDLE